jgi:soluble lytic murein transglycosylase-like protein
MLEPIDNYYFSKGKYILRSRWPKRVKAVIATVIFAVSLFFVQETANIQYTNEWDSEYVEYIQKSNPKVDKKDAKAIVLSALKWAYEFNLDPKLILAIAKVESNYYKHAISTSGAYGVMQVIPVWHKDKILEARKVTGNPEIFNIDTNIYLGARVIKDCLNKHGTINKALLCYSGQTPGYDKKVINEYTRL